jgi:putative membrane protein
MCRESGASQKIPMKNNLTMISRFGILSVLLGSLCFVTGASAQGEYSRPMDSGQMPQTVKTRMTPTPAPQAKKGEAAPAALSAQDKAFIMNAAKGGMMEVEWGKWAAQNGQSADVKKFGNMMVTDHSKANNELMGLAAKKGVKVKSEKVKGKWTSDKDYMDMMVKDHEKVWAEFQAEAKNGNDPDLKKWAGDTAKVIKKHLDMAKKTQAKLK